MYRMSAVMLALALVLPATAADKFDAEARARTIAPFVDGQTIVLARVDLTRIDADALFGWAVEIGRLDAREIEGPRRAVQDWLTSLTKAGGKELYFVVSLAEVLPSGLPLMVVPLAEGSDAQAVRRLLGRVKAFGQIHFETIDQALVGGSEEARKRLKDAKPPARPELAKAFAAAGDTCAQLLLLPTPDTRRVIAELLPTLPPPVGGSTRPLSHGLLWAALGVDLPPKLSARLVVQSRDADSALALRDLLSRSLKILVEQPAPREWLPVIGQLIAVFTPRVEQDRLTISIEDKDLKPFLMPMVQSIHQSVQRRTVENNLHQLAIALANYADTNKGRYPAVANFDKQGKPLLSWRVHLLPYVGAIDLYRQFRLDEPWDSPHNKKLLAQMPIVYQGPNRKLNAEGKTIYLVPVGKDAAFKGGPERMRFPQDFSDGTSNTIIIVEADDDHAVPWTKPEDLTYDREHPERGLGGHFQGALCVAALADGSARMIAKGITKKTLQLAFDPADGMPLGSDW